MRPDFELDQILRYVDFVSKDGRTLSSTVESHFFPVLQRIFFEEGFEVRRNCVTGGRTFPFELVDLDTRKPGVLVDFAFSASPDDRVVLPSFAWTWKSDSETGHRLLVLRNRPLNAASSRLVSSLEPEVRFLDFEGLKAHTRSVFEQSGRRAASRVIIVVTEMIEALIRAVAEDGKLIESIQWFDLERLFLRVLTGLGYLAHATPFSHDGGRDILACELLVDDVKWYAIEIKHWSKRKPGKREVEAFLETSIREGRAGAVFVSTSGVSSKAVEIRTRAGADYLHFSDRAQVVGTCQHYVRVKSGVWQPHQSLRALLFAQTPGGNG